MVDDADVTVGVQLAQHRPYGHADLGMSTPSSCSDPSLYNASTGRLNVPIPCRIDGIRVRNGERPEHTSFASVGPDP